MLQFIVTLLPMLAVIAAVFAAASKLKSVGNRMMQIFDEFGWAIDNSPAQVAFFMFSFTAAIAAALLSAVFAHVSNQLILSLDIIFFLSSILLILFHQFKEFAPASL